MLKRRRGILLTRPSCFKYSRSMTYHDIWIRPVRREFNALIRGVIGCAANLVKECVRELFFNERIGDHYNHEKPKPLRVFESKCNRSLHGMRCYGRLPGAYPKLQAKIPDTFDPYTQTNTG